MPLYPEISRLCRGVRETDFSPPPVAGVKPPCRPNDVIPLHIGDSYLLPARAALDISLSGGQTHRYGSVTGLENLRRVTSDYLSRVHALGFDPEQIFLAAGAIGALSVAVEALFDPLDEVVVLTPSWPVIFGILERRGVKVVEVPVGEDGVPTDDASSFETRLRAALNGKTAGIFYCDPNNPSGFLYPEGFVDVIERIAVAHSLWILSDIVYVDLVFEGRPRLIASSPKVREHCIVVGSFSKTYALAGHRVGYLAVPPGLCDLIPRLLIHSIYHASILAQEMALASLLQGADHIFDSYKAGAEITASLLSGKFSPARAGGFVFLDFRSFGVQTRGDLDQLLVRFLESGVSLCPGYAFGSDFCAFARLCFTATPPTVLKSGIRRINRTLLELETRFVSSSSNINH